jgi:hypothetical protein
MQREVLGRAFGAPSEATNRFSNTARRGRYHLAMAQAAKLTNAEIDRRRAAAERMRGLFADVAPGRSLVDELIADRRAEAQAEGRERKAPRRSA